MMSRDRKYQKKAICPLCNKLRWCNQYCGGFVSYMCPSCDKIVNKAFKLKRENDERWKHLRIYKKYMNKPRKKQGDES